MYCYPEEIYEELINAMIRDKKVCHYLDMPIQHCNDSILQRMGRKTNKKELTARIDHLRERIPDITLRTTLICGFPGETQQMHEELMQFVNDMEFDRLGAFTYSAEEGTPAAEMPDQIDEEQKIDWQADVMELQELSLIHIQMCIRDSFKDDQFIWNLMKQLPYDLTGAQKRTLEEIVANIQGPYVMQRLIPVSYTHLDDRGNELWWCGNLSLKNFAFVQKLQKQIRRLGTSEGNGRTR